MMIGSVVVVRAERRGGHCRLKMGSGFAADAV